MRLALLFSLLPALALAQGIPIKSGSTSDLAAVDTRNNVRVSEGQSVRPTFIATVTGATTTAAWNLQVESAAGTGFKVYKICVAYGLGATAAGTIVTTTVSRRTTASSAGTALTNNGTGTTAVTDLSGAGVAYGGLARGLAATLGTAGATVDQWAHRQNVLAATTAVDPISVVCREYGKDGTMPIIVQAGVTNGLAVNVSAGGAGSVAVGSISIWFVAE
jgi:hypothetical protein